MGECRFLAWQRSDRIRIEGNNFVLVIRDSLKPRIPRVHLNEILERYLVMTLGLEFINPVHFLTFFHNQFETAVDMRITI